MNNQYTNNPTYIDLIKGIYRNLKWFISQKYWIENKAECRSSLYSRIMENLDFNFADIYIIVVFTLVFTIVRYNFENLFCQVSLFS